MHMNLRKVHSSSYLGSPMATKKYDQRLVDRVRLLRQGLGPQPLAQLWSVSPELQDEAPKYRRILCYKCYPGDRGHVEKLEQARTKLMKARHV